MNFVEELKSIQIGKNNYKYRFVTIQLVFTVVVPEVVKTQKIYPSNRSKQLQPLPDYPIINATLPRK